MFIIHKSNQFSSIICSKVSIVCLNLQIQNFDKLRKHSQISIIQGVPKGTDTLQPFITKKTG